MTNKIADILKKSLIEAGQRKSFFEGTYVKLNSDTFKWFISQAEAALKAHFKSLLPPLPHKKCIEHSKKRCHCISDFLADIERTIDKE